MRILFTTVDPVEIGRGHYTHIKELVEGLERRGVQITMLFGFDGKPNIRSSGGFIDTGARLTRRDRIKDFFNQYLAISHIGRYIRNYAGNYDLIYGRDWILGSIGDCLDVPTISEFNGITSQLRMYKRGGILSRLYTGLLVRREKKAVVNSSLIICVSDSILNYLENVICPGYQHKMQVIDNGVNLEHYLFQESKFRADRIKIAFIGSFSYWHGVEYIAPTLRQILDKHKEVDLLLIGTGPNLKRVQVDLDEYWKRGQVEFTGRISIAEAAKALNECHIGFSPHRPGVLGAPLKIREYCAAGLALVASGIEGTEFISENGLGLVVKAGNITGFQLAFENLLRNKALMTGMATKARRYTENYLSWNNSIEKVYAACKEVRRNI